MDSGNHCERSPLVNSDQIGKLGVVAQQSSAFRTRRSNRPFRLPQRLVSDSCRPSIGDPRLAPSDRRPPALRETPQAGPAADRFFWAWISSVWNGWESRVSIIKAATVIGWQRKGFGLFWSWRIRRGKPGCPAVPKEVRKLIRMLSQENPLWGAPHIHGELLKLGINVGKTSVGKYMVRRRTPPSQTWRTFLDNHLKTLVSVDFFVVPTIRFQILYSVSGAGA